MRRLAHPEAALYCLAWASVAVAGAILIGWRTGIALTVGLFLIVMPSSALILSRTGSFTLERRVRWAILIAAAVVAATFGAAA